MSRLTVLLVMAAASGAVAEDFADMRGANYVPSYARNDVQLWMDYDPAVIDRELGYAARLKLNTVRVFLQFAVYERDPALFLQRFENFLSLCEKHQIRMMPVVFDSCFGEFPDLVNYKDKNWMANPGQNRLGREHWPKLEHYVRDVVGGHRDDRRIVMWDVMNEPTCTSFNKPEDKELIWTFLRHFLDYVKQVDPNHPLTVGVEHSSLIPQVLDKIDVLATHNYRTDLREDLRAVKALAQPHGKAVIINEVAGRPKQPYSYVMPILAEEKVGWCFWELMIGRTQFSQGTAPYQGVIYPDGTCYDAAEVMHIVYPGQAGLEPRKVAAELGLPQTGPSKIPNTDRIFQYSDGWTLWTGSGPWPGTLRYNNSAGGWVDVDFEGTAVHLVHKVGPDCGLAQVFIDGKPATAQHGGQLKADARGDTFLDTYGSAVDWNRRTTVARGLPPGKHKLTIVVTGDKDYWSSDCYVQIVGVDVEYSE